MTETSPIVTYNSPTPASALLEGEKAVRQRLKQSRAACGTDMKIVDRSKDVIKSGCEWISSIALENLAVSHPAVAEAAIIAARHPKWQERPLLLIVPRAGARIAKWWLPDDVLMLEELPHTATGKLNKLALRARYQDHLIESAKAQA
jgi:acyl-CoA synthetase (AMP-forming)/AMP-acid ligase II